MAFWRLSNTFSTASPIDKILDQPDFTLTDVLHEPDVIQELIAPNTKLVEYLREPETMRQLVKLVTDVQVREEEHENKQPQPPKEESPQDEANDQEPPQEPPVEPPTNQPEDSEEKQDSNDNQHPDSTENTSPNTSNDTLNEPNESNDANDSIKKDDDNEHPLSAVDLYNDEDEEDDEDTSAQHYAHVASEILSAEVWSITEAFMACPELLEDLWQILDHAPPLSMTYVNYFTKINEALLDRKTDEMLAFIKSQDNFVQRFMKHVDNPPLMDFLLKVISSDKPEAPTGIIEFLQQQHLIPSFIAFLGPTVSSSTQSAAGDFLKAFVAISANSNSDNTTIGPNELSRELVSEACIKELVRLMLFGGTGLATGVGVVIEIIRKNNSDYDATPVINTTLESHPPSSRDPIYLGTLVQIFADNIPNFHTMLTKRHDEILKTPFGQIEPLGFERFKICELVAELLHCSNMALLNDAAGAEIVRTRDKERNRIKRIMQRAAEGVEYDENTLEDEDEVHVHAKELSEEDEPPKPEEDVPMVDVSNDVEEKLKTLQVNEPAGAELTSPDYPNSNQFREAPVVGDKLKLALYDNQVITYILNMFFRFPWNNFLHNVVFDIVQQVLNGPMNGGFNRYLAIDLFHSGRLISLICEGQQQCAEYQATHKTRLGYMGHLTLISEEVVKFTALFTPSSVSPIVEQCVSDEAWDYYVMHTLTRIREQYNAILGGQDAEDSPIHTNPDAIILRNDDQPFDDEEDDEEDDDDDDDDDKRFGYEENTSDEDADGEYGRRALRSPEDGEGDFQRRSRRGSRGEEEAMLGYDEDDSSSDEDTRPEPADGETAPLKPQKSNESSGSGKVFLFGSKTSDDEEEEDKKTAYHSDDDEEEEEEEQATAADDDEDEGLGLVRSQSHHEMNWNPEEAQRIVETYQREKEASS